MLYYPCLGAECRRFESCHPNTDNQIVAIRIAVDWFFHTILYAFAFSLSKFLPYSKAFKNSKIPKIKKERMKGIIIDG
jgi:hypothetical protein